MDNKNLSWNNPELNDISHIPVLDEYYFTNSKYTMKYKNAKNKKQYIRDYFRNNFRELSKTNFKKIARSSFDSLKDDKTKVDNSKWCTDVQDQEFRDMGVSYAITALLEYNYKKTLEQLNSSIIIFRGKRFKCVKNEGPIINFREISEKFSIKLCMFGDTTTSLIVHNDLVDFTLHGEGGVNIYREGLYCDVYGENKETGIIDIEENILYILIGVPTSSNSGIEIKAKRLINECKKIQFSPWFIHHNVPNNIIHCALESIIREGVCSSNKYNKNDFGKTPQIDESFIYKINEYYRIYPSLDAVRSFLDEGYCIIGGFNYFYNFLREETTLSGIVGMPESKIIGGHVVLFVGYDNEKKLFKFKNCFGKCWGDDGYGYIPYDYLAMGLMGDLWVITEY